MKDIKKISKRLLDISYQITKIFDELSNLSYYNQENSQQFKDLCEDLEKLFNTESIILNNLTIKELDTIYEYLSESDDESDKYSRCLDVLCETADDRELNSDAEEEIATDTDFESEIDEETKDEVIENIKYFFKDEEDNQEYTDYVINKVAIIALKKMADRINKTSVDNQNDKAYKKRLIRELREFKYYVFRLNLKMEKLALKHHFNIESIPDLVETDEDLSNIYYNQVLLLLDELYSVEMPINDHYEVAEALFHIICFEECLEKAEPDYEKMLEYIQKIKEKIKGKTIGDFAHQKILKKNN